MFGYSQPRSNPVATMPSLPILRLGSVKDPAVFLSHLAALGLDLPFDADVVAGAGSPLAAPATVGGLTIGNRWTIHPMEGWDGTTDGKPTEATVRRWRHFGLSGAKLIWGGEAVAIRHDGRANPNQLLMTDANLGDIAGLRDTLVAAHVEQMGPSDGLVVGLQLTHSGRYSKPNDKQRMEPRIVFRHPVLDRRLQLGPGYPVMTDGEIRQLIDDYVAAAKKAADLGFDFVDVKHCHGYLGHEFLGAHTRKGEFGGSFENRTRYLREIVAGIRAVAPGLKVGVRLSAFDFVPYKPDPAQSTPGKLGPGVPEEHPLPYRYGFGVNENDASSHDLAEPTRFLELLRSLDVRLVNLSAGSPYYNPHVQRPALYPPSDGYQPPEDPLVGVARQIHAHRQLKASFPDLYLVGTGYTYLQDFLPNVAQAAVRQGWIDSVGLGRMVLSYPDLPADVLAGRPFNTKKVCRTFSDCTTAPRNGLPSGCYPLDDYYKGTDAAAALKAIKKGK
ncbi:MAG: namA 2 [Phycisphaerales bacterium]|nr:namA 2 [Phycisphaerales bacterium]